MAVTFTFRTNMTVHFKFLLPFLSLSFLFLSKFISCSFSNNELSPMLWDYILRFDVHLQLDFIKEKEILIHFLLFLQLFNLIHSCICSECFHDDLTFFHLLFQFYSRKSYLLVIDSPISLNSKSCLLNNLFSSFDVHRSYKFLPIGLDDNSSSIFFMFEISLL